MKPGAYEPVIDESTFQVAQQILLDRPAEKASEVEVASPENAPEKNLDSIRTSHLWHLFSSRRGRVRLSKREWANSWRSQTRPFENPT